VVSFKIMRKHDLLVLSVALGFLMGLSSVAGAIAQGTTAQVVAILDGSGSVAATPTSTATPPRTLTVTPTPTVEATLCPGECIEETKEIFIPPAPGKTDVLFAFDTTNSMRDVLSSAKSNTITITNNLAGIIPDIQFGVGDLRDYPTKPYGNSLDWPYMLRQGITDDRMAVQTAINALDHGGGWDDPEAYTRALYESYSDPAIGWRADARRFVVMFGDDVPHDDNLNEGVPDPPENPGGTWVTGYPPSYLDPGRDGIPGTADDLDFQSVLDGMRTNSITLLCIESPYGGSTSPANLVIYWKQWAGWTNSGGDAVPLSDVADLATVIQDLVTATSRHISRLELLADPSSYQSWLTVKPPDRTDLTVPPEGLTVTFDVRICVPSGTPSGTYSFSINAVGDGAVYGGQGVTIEVPAWCYATPTPTPTPTDTPTPTPTPTNTPTPTPAPMPVEECYCCSPGDNIYRIDGSSFYGYDTDSAYASPLKHVDSPPAPWGWNQPNFEPVSPWQPASEVWWDNWDAPIWEPLPDDGKCRPIGLQDKNGNPEGQSEVTHLYRRKFDLRPPHPSMEVDQAVLEMWSDNKTAWWWGGDGGSSILVSHDREGYIGQVDLLPLINPDGGTYVLAIQNSNDRASLENPHGTACRLCINWAFPSALGYQVYLPLILKRYP
jgi:hypothetical protein